MDSHGSDDTSKLTRKCVLVCSRLRYNLRASYLSLPPQTTAPEDYRLTFRSPSDCAPSECSFFAGVQTNEGDSNYLDFYLEGAAAGWVAIGVSETASMVKRVAWNS